MLIHQLEVTMLTSVVTHGGLFFTGYYSRQSGCHGNLTIMITLNKTPILIGAEDGHCAYYPDVALTKGINQRKFGVKKVQRLSVPFFDLIPRI